MAADKDQIISTLAGINEGLRISLRHMQIERDNATLRLRIDKLERHIAKLQRQIINSTAQAAAQIFRGLE